MQEENNTSSPRIMDMHTFWMWMFSIACLPTLIFLVTVVHIGLSPTMSFWGSRILADPYKDHSSLPGSQRGEERLRWRWGSLALEGVKRVQSTSFIYVLSRFTRKATLRQSLNVPSQASLMDLPFTKGPIPVLLTRTQPPLWQESRGMPWTDLYSLDPGVPHLQPLASHIDWPRSRPFF